MPWILSLFLLLFTIGGASAQTGSEYPTRQVTMLVPFAPGGFPDIVARVLGQRLSETLGQTFVVDNRPSAGAIVAGEAVAKAAPDGYTLMIASAGFWSINPYLYKTLPFDPIKSFAPIAMLGAADIFWAVNTKIAPVADLPTFIKFVKENPGKYNYGTPGVGVVQHLAAEAFKAQAGIDIVQVPYKGGAQLQQDLLAGDIVAGFVGLGSAQTLFESGTVKILAVSNSHRSSFVPDIPTFGEQGVPGVEFPGSVAVLAPANTPSAVLTKLSSAFKEALGRPEVLDKFKGLGIEATYSPPQGLTAIMASDSEKYGRAFKAAGIKPE